MAIDPDASQTTPEPTAEPVKALTLRLSAPDWLALKRLAAELSVERGRSVTSHAILLAAAKAAIAGRADGLELGGDER
jgi:hypothetical protein